MKRCQCNITCLHVFSPFTVGNDSGYVISDLPQGQLIFLASDCVNQTDRGDLTHFRLLTYNVVSNDPLCRGTQRTLIIL